MSRIELFMACAALSAAIGCGGGGRPVGDAGHTDAGARDGQIVVMIDGGHACAPMNVPAPTTAVCAAATMTCIMGCADDTCIQGCIDADPAGMDCLGCLNQAIFACATAHGCNDEYGNVDCCATAMCTNPANPCVTGTGPCVTQFNTFDACITALPAGTCAGVLNPCFMAAP